MLKYVYYTPKSGKTLARQPRMTRKLSPTQAHVIVKDYVKIQSWDHRTFAMVKDLLIARNISRNVPSKLLKRFHMLREEFHVGEEIDYAVNVFLERSQLRKHRAIPQNAAYEQYVKKYPRWWHQTYISHCRDKKKEPTLKAWKFYYYKDAMKLKTWSAKTGSMIKKSKQSSCKMVAKEWYNKLYENYDLVVHIDGKSMEDQINIRKNAKLKSRIKWLSLAVEAKSGVIVWIRMEKSHNKTNAGTIFRQVIEQIEHVWWARKKICFITDAWSEYVNNWDMRGIDITDTDTSKLAHELRLKGHWWRITRRPEDNSFVENKNDYIERACLDNPDIQQMDVYEFMCHVEKFLQRQNRYLPWSQNSFRWKGRTPQENIAQRLWKKEAEDWLDSIHVQQIEMLHRLSYEYRHETILSMISLFVNHVKPMKRRSKNTISYDLAIMHPKSLDSSIFVLT